MRRIATLGFIVCLNLAACDRDPARSLKIAPQSPPVAAPAPAPRTETPATAPASIASIASIVEPRRPTDDIVHPAQPTKTSETVAPAKPTTSSQPAQSAAWHPDGCPPPALDATGPDVLAVDGPCAFEHRAPAACESLADDFLVTMTRKGANGATVMVYINVEQYKGPGHYDGAQIFLGVQDKVNIYRWSSDTVTITVGDGEAFATLPRTELTPEPLLAHCTGPMTNYQCEGREMSTPIEKTVEFVSGTLRCEKSGMFKGWPPGWF